LHAGQEACRPDEQLEQSVSCHQQRAAENQVDQVEHSHLHKTYPSLRAAQGVCCLQSEAISHSRTFENGTRDCFVMALRRHSSQ